jgi:hypothetical protein
MAKAAIYLDDARRKYVEDGIGLDALVGIFGNKISRKTLYNWKTDGEWDEKRKAFLAANQDIKARLQRLALDRLSDVEKNPTAKGLKMMLLAFAAVEKYGDGNILNDETTTPEQKKTIKEITSSPEFKEIIKGIYGL